MPQTPNSKSPKASSGAAKNARPAKAMSTQAQSAAKKKTLAAPKKAAASKRKASAKKSPTKKSIAAKTVSAKTGTTGARAAKSPKKAAATTASKSRAGAAAKDQNEKSSWVANVRANLESRGEEVKKFNIRLIDIAHKDTDQFFDMSRAVVRARSWPEVMEIQAQYVSDRINCYRADDPINESPKSTVNVFAWIAKQAGAALNTGNAARNG